MKSISTLIILLLLSDMALADWTAHGAQSQCIDSKEFTLLPIIETSGGTETPLQVGFQRIEGKKSLYCQIGPKELAIEINVIPPKAKGMCMGMGAVDLLKVELGGVPLVYFQQMFNWPCGFLNRRTFIKMKVSYDKNNPLIEMCDAKEWTWDEGYTDIQCHQVIFDSDSNLNKAYANAMKKLSSKNQNDLKHEKLKWIKERNIQCNQKYSELMSSAPSPIEYVNCIQSITNQRTIKVNAWVK